jgi:tryptophan synthase beta chain/phosphoribosylanthranilate isomerase
MLIKICGLTDPETARFAVEQGAHFIGLLFSDLSPRKIDLKTAKSIVDAVREAGGEPVGVFADETLTEILAIVHALDLQLVQLHGENPRAAALQLPMAKIYVADGKPLPPHLNPERDYLLFEKHFQDPLDFRFFVAGGLNSENVGGAIEKYRPSGVDVSSGVEERLAVKSRDKIAAFIKAARPGRFGPFGGMYVPELLVAPLQELAFAFEKVVKSAPFQEQFLHLLHTYAGRPTALTEIPHFANAIGGPRIFLKREDLLHTGAHKINNAIGQCLLAKMMGKKRVIAETGAGQHGVATATACALLGLECVIYMGSKDMERQAPNVMKMELLGAKVVPVDGGSATLKDAVNEALRDWASSFDSTHYCLGSALGPHPFPSLVAHFQKCIGREAKRQMQERIGKNPDLCIACVGGGSNAIGLFSAYVDEEGVALIGVEAGGKGEAPGEHAARFQGGSPGVLHGAYTYVLQDEGGQINPTHSVSAGLDYPAVGPAHAALHLKGRARYETCTDSEALAAFKLLARTEGIIPALESSHALGYLTRIAKTLPKETIVLVNLSGRGEKDLNHVAHL